MNNTIIFHEIISQSPADLSGFYRTIFDWKLTQFSEVPELVSIQNSVIQPFGLPGGPAPAGLLTQQSSEPGYQKNTLFYIQVESIDKTLEAVIKRGGKVVLPKTTDPIGDYEYTLAVFSDPENNHIGIMEPVQIEATDDIIESVEINESEETVLDAFGNNGINSPVTASQFAFNEIITPNPATLAKQFYEPIFDWNITETGTPEAPFFEVVTDIKDIDARPQLGIAKEAKKAGFSQFNGFYIQVDDVTGTLQKIKRHDGRILMPPTQIPLSNKTVEIAMFCDPQHNRIGLINFDL